MANTRRTNRIGRTWNGMMPGVQAPFLFGIWLLFSGKLDAFHIGAGVLAVFFVVWLDRKLGPVNFGREDAPLRPHPVRFFLYIIWLVWQMLLSSWHVARMILSPSMPLDPRLVRFNCAQPHTIARVVLGNSITLTPGTLTLDIDGDRYLVHSLSNWTTEGLCRGDMQRKVARMFRAEDQGTVTDVEIVRGEIRGGIQG